jgi:hypothetical protein
MFGLFHFSRVFPFIHPCLFPRQTSRGQLSVESVCPAAVRVAAPQRLPAQLEPVAVPAQGAGKRLKSLYRRRQLNQCHALSYSSGLRHDA